MTPALRVAACLALLIAGGWPWPPIARAFSAAYAGAINALVLEGTTFGAGGRARLQPLADTAARPGDAVVADTALSFTVSGFEGELALGMSSRRDAHLPLLLLVALILVAPLRPRAKARALLIGGSALVAATLAALYLMIVWTFAVRLQGVYDLSPFGRGTIDLAVRTLLLPPANRFLFPLLLAVSLTLRAGSAATPGGAHDP